MNKEENKEEIKEEKEYPNMPSWVGSRPVAFGSEPFDADNIGPDGYYI